jgi:hypothetical protein
MKRTVIFKNFNPRTKMFLGHYHGGKIRYMWDEPKANVKRISRRFIRRNNRKEI